MDKEFEAVARHITERTGLSLSETQHRYLTPFLEGRFAALGCATAGDYLKSLDQPEEFRALVDFLTVKETFFYRGDSQFEVFRKELLPGFLSRASASGRRVRLWSAGCCTGEEAYTLALLAEEAGCGDAVEIMATDINEGYLEAAMKASYSRRSVERLPPSLIEKHFTREGERFLVRDLLRRRVSFKFLNLAEPSFPSFVNATAGLDMIFCRNVLIYFSPKKAEEILARFRDCLAVGGLLALGYSEILPPGGAFVVHQAAEAFFYRPRAAEAPAGAAGASAGAAGASTAPVPRSPRAPRRPAPIGKAIGTGPGLDPPNVQAALLLEAESLADQGRFQEAQDLCLRVVRRQPMAEKAHYLLGLMLMSEPRGAVEHFRRVVTLNPGHALARLHLARCCEKLGQVPEAEREFRNLERIAAARPPEDVLDAKEGMTCGLMSLICRRALQGLRQEAGR